MSINAIVRPILLILVSLAPVQADTAANHLTNGLAKLKAGDVAGAESELRAAVQLGTTDPQAHNLLGFICDRTNRPTEALAEYQAALTLNPNFVPAHNNLGAFYLAHGNAAEALAQFELSLKTVPNDVTAHYNLALIYGQQGRFAEAIQSMERAHQYAPDDLSIIVVLSTLQMEAHDGQGVLRSAGEILDLLQRSTSVPGATQAISETVNTLANLSATGTAENNRLFLLAEFHFLAKEYDQVLVALSALPENRRDSDYYNLLGLAEARKGNFPEARASLAKAIQMAPHRADLLFNMGSVYQSAKDNNTAVALFKRAIAAGDTSPDTELALALGYFNFGNYDEAIKTCLHIVEQNPRFDQALLLLGRSYAGAAKNEQAAAAIRKALAVNPGCEQCYLHVSIVLMDLGRDMEAIGLLKKGIDINPADASAHFQLGKALARQKQNTTAISELQKAIDLDPNQDLAYYQLGRVFLAMGDRGKAKTYLAAAEAMKESRRADAQARLSQKH